MKVRQVKIADIRIEGRFREDLGDLTELILSIRANGILQPVTLDTELNLIAGERRVRAAKEAELKTVPAVIRELKGELDAREIEWIENICRKDFTWNERSKLEKEIFSLKKAQDPKWTQEDHVSLLGTSKGAASRRLQLAEAFEFLPELEDCKTQDEAWKKLKSIEEELVTRELMKDGDEKFRVAAKWADNYYILGDARKGLKKIHPGVVNFIEVDPPYAVDLKRRKSRNLDESYMDNYNEISAGEYPAFIKEVGTECYRILTDNSFMIWWFGQEWYEVVKKTLEGIGFGVGSIPAIWVKGGSGQTASPDTMLGSSYEPFFICRKGQPKIRKSGRSNVFSFDPVAPQNKVHPTERPLDLMMEIINTFVFPNALICVPFLGSGVTLRAAYKLRVKGYGWDFDEMTKSRFVNQVWRDLGGVDGKEAEEDQEG